ncbi:dUTP diphosphatase [Lysinibacillus fusiformis]|uniref:dUTP diphosphatase n=1 Tax=Lysinibacillus fusiformis TaxID=28031 RepID=UPI0004695BF1|nr:dUTP diphosphatase [Lysinibacillus fusiformis]
MNLTKLFETQAKLDEHIMQEHMELQGQNNLDWKLLALQVELGECANEWRGFKKWSKNQRPNTLESIECSSCGGKGVLLDWGAMSFWECECCKGTGNDYESFNPLLIEYVDCLHLILSIGLEDFTYIQFGEKFTGPVRLELTNDFGAIKYHNTTTQFLYLFNKISNLADCILECEMTYANETFELYKQTWQMFVGLGEMLGFTWEQVEEAYYAKNKVNHERQESGY